MLRAYSVAMGVSATESVARAFCTLILDAGLLRVGQPPKDHFGPSETRQSPRLLWA